MLELLGEGWSRHLDTDERISFGRGGSGVDVAIADDARLHRHCGTIVATADGWEIHNTGRWLRIRVVSLDRSGSDHLSPGQMLRVPWSAARIEVQAGPHRHRFTARLEAGIPDAPPATVEPGDAHTAAAVRVDRSSGYFRALVALCEAQLLDPSSTAVATDLQIALRLNRSGTEQRRLSGKSVERRLDACRRRFGLKDANEHGQSAGLERSDARRQLVEVALLTATVTATDLAVLQPDG